MNDYLEGCLDTCRQLSENKLDFLKNVKMVTGLTIRCMDNDIYIQKLLKTYKW